MKTTNVALADIAIDGGTQQRERINTDVVSEYAEAIRCGAKFPAVKLFFDGAQHWLGDGFHRYHAHRQAEVLEILADVQAGTKRDALLFSASANGTHGMRLTNADKRKSVLVLLLDKEWTQWSNKEIAKHCHVGPSMVDKLRKELDGTLAQVKKALTAPAEKPPTVGAPTPEANNDAGVNSETPKKEAVETPTSDPDTYDPDDYVVPELQAALSAVVEENEALKAKQAVLEVGPEGQEVLDLIASLRKQITTLEAELDAAKTSYNICVRENADMKTQLNRQRNEIKKLKGGK